MDRLVSVVSLLLALAAVSSGATLPESRIGGGSPVERAEFPWIASLRSDNVHFCGGSIVNRRWILTSAACLLDKNVSSTRIVTNTLYLNSGGDHYPASRFVIHPEYIQDTFARNVALVQVPMNIVFDGNVQPVALPTSDRGHVVSLTNTLRVAGWGSTSWLSSTPSNQLLSLNTRTVSNIQCRLYFPRYFSEETICSYNAAGSGICYGDTGGPLMYNNGTIFGVLSTHLPCNLAVPDISIRVFPQLDWINSVIAIN